jgi:hypothetical protein
MQSPKNVKKTKSKVITTEEGTMSKKRNTKKPRAMSINIGIDSRDSIIFKWSEEKQTLSYQVLRNEQPSEPINTIISIHYDRVGVC